MAAKRRTGRRPNRGPYRRLPYVTDVLALKGPDGPAGDVRALLLAAPRDDNFEGRKNVVQKTLRVVETVFDAETRQAIARALYPFVLQHWQLRVNEDARASARHAAKREPHVAPAAAIAYIDELIARYRHVDAIWEPLTQARAGLVAFARNPTPPPWRHVSPTRLETAGNPVTRQLASKAREALRRLRAPARDEDGNAIKKRGQPDLVAVLSDEQIPELLQAISLLPGYRPS